MSIEYQSSPKTSQHAAGGLSRTLRFIACCCGIALQGLFQIPAIAQAAESACGPLQLGYGPYDYRGADPYKLQLVEGAHFSAQVEHLISYRSGADLDYTLRAFPNHHRALLAVVRLSEKHKTLNPPDMRFPVECWFERALRFRSDDYIVRMIYATFLNSRNRLADAMAQLLAAKNEAKDNPFTHFNIGLVYFDLKQYDKALEQAHRAIELGFTRTDLRDRLTSVGKWTDAPAKSP